MGRRARSSFPISRGSGSPRPSPGRSGAATRLCCDTLAAHERGGRPGPAAYVEIGWGDRDYYPAEGFNLWYAIKAIAWPSASVLHVTGFDEPPARRFPASEVIELRLAPAA
ncbi:MAG TPA: DUF2459 domain-containing protein [Burkholderiales bacterium]|nr:DUF2459 domain-containing protein [Burkholderiales bacterium]